MTDVTTPGLTALAKVVLVLSAAFIVAGIAWHGVSVEAWQRMWRDLIERPGGPMTFRFVLQPIMAGVAAWRDGAGDARAGRAPYLWTLLHDPHQRLERLSEGLAATARIVLLGLGMDALYQLTVFRTFYPVEAVNIAFALACVPYILLRGPFARLARR
jgi:hypothetical protein